MCPKMNVFRFEMCEIQRLPLILSIFGPEISDTAASSGDPSTWEAKKRQTQPLAMLRRPAQHGERRKVHACVEGCRRVSCSLGGGDGSPSSGSRQQGRSISCFVGVSYVGW